MKYILAAIDGTSSSDWRRTNQMGWSGDERIDGGYSHTAHFAHDFGRNLSPRDYRKRFWEGPNNVINAGDAPGIRSEVLAWIERSINQLIPRIPPIMYAPRRAGEPTPQFLIDDRKARAERQRQISSHRHLRVILVGHSRGGALAIDIANRLRVHNIEVYFMGLFDAVQNSTHINAGRISNCKYTFHARRNLEMGSRPIFVNAGLFGESVEEYFDTSHGGVGGGIDLHPDDFTDDFTCQITVPRPTYLNSGGDMHVYAYKQLTYNRRNLEAAKTAALCMSESRRAYIWMIEKAIEKFIPIQAH